MAAYGQTRLQIINAVLSRLREGTVATSSSTTYASLVATVLNSVKTEIEHAWQWRQLRDTYNVTVVPNTTCYSLTGSGQFGQVIDAWNTTTNRPLERGTTADFNEKFFGVSTVQRGPVTHYNPVGLDASYDLQIDTWPNVESSNNLKVNVYAPEVDPATDSTVILVPNQVLIEGMLAYLLAERGDDNGTGVQTQMQLYQRLLGDAISVDAGHDPSEVDFYPV